MFVSIILNFVLIVMSLNGILCSECKDHEKPCSSLEELSDGHNCFTEWVYKKCPDNTTVLEQPEIDTFKNCIKTHLEPCLQAKEDEVFKKIFVDIVEKYDLCHVCATETQKKIKDDLVDIHTDHKDQMDKRGAEKCSMIKEAMHQVMVCAHI